MTERNPFKATLSYRTAESVLALDFHYTLLQLSVQTLTISLSMLTLRPPIQRLYRLLSCKAT